MIRFFFFFFLSSSLVSYQLFGAPKANLWPRWTKHNSKSTQNIDHTAWNHFLAKYVESSHSSGINLIRYKSVTSQDRDKLKKYLQFLQSIKISDYNREEQKAYWINLYNALTVKVILDKYPVDTILDINISPGIFSRGPWDAQLINIEGERLSLNDIEHRILRPIWKDNRIHYAVNCASYGCPDLATKAYTSENIEELLNQGAKGYIHHPRGLSWDGQGLVLSKIYNWYQDDFGGNEAGVIKHIMKYANDKLKKKLQRFDEDVDYKYDWKLNQP